jgi:hypothetical protein
MPSEMIPFETLLSYAAGDLDAATEDDVSRRLDASPADRERCIHIRGIVEMLRSARSEAPSAYVVERARALFRSPARDALTWIDRVAALVARCVYDNRAEPALAGVRSSDETIQLAFETGDTEVDLQAEPVAGDAGRWRLIGQVGDGGAEIPVALTQAGSNELVACTSADAHGVFSLEAHAGTYDILLHLGEARVAMLPEIRIA